MNRRSFIETLLGSTVALALVPRLDLLAADVPSPAVLLEGWAAVLQEGHRLFLQEMRAGGLPVDPLRIEPEAHLIGGTFRDGTLVTDQCNVGVDSGSHQDCWLGPAMRALAGRSLDYGLDRYGVLAAPQGVEYAGTLGPLRLVVAYDIRSDRDLVRFDVLGGPLSRAKP